jgi:hypothetical protein
VITVHLLEIAVTIICSVIASSGFWAFIQYRTERKSAKNRMILGLGHDRIISLCQQYIERGYITPDEYENLHDYLYLPYEKMGGNGSAKRLMDKVNTLPTKP